MEETPDYGVDLALELMTAGIGASLEILMNQTA